MRISVTNALWLSPALAFMLVLQGCNEKPKPVQAQTLAPPIVDAPPPKPATVSTADLPPPVVGPPPETGATSDAANKPPTTPKKPAHHPRPTPAATTSSPVATPGQPAQPTQETAAAPSSATSSVSAIGELSSGASGDQKSQTEATINSTEKGLNAITRPLNDSETKTAAQIREFLKQARAALNTGDVDGALTLTKKAKVLLAELNQ
jgi:hypothetical protein